MIGVSMTERVALIVHCRPDDLFLVQLADGETSGRRRWGFPVTERDLRDAETPMAAVRRIAKNSFNYEMDAKDHARCFGLESYRHGDTLYLPILMDLEKTGQFAPPPGSVAQWKTFGTLILLTERGLFPQTHLVLLNTANEHLNESRNEAVEEDPFALLDELRDGARSGGLPGDDD